MGAKMYPAQEFYAQLEKYRQDQRWTRNEMASRLGISPQRYGYLGRSERVRARTAKDWCERLGIPYEEPEDYKEYQLKSTAIKNLAEIYPKEFFAFLESEEGYSIAMATFANYQKDAMTKQVGEKFRQGLETLQKKRLHGKVAATLGV